MAVKTLKGNNFSWHYITEFGDEELNFLKKNFKFHPLDLKDCAGETQRTKIDFYKNYFFLVLQLPVFDETYMRVSINQVFFFVGKNFVVTIARERMKSMNNFFYRTAKSQKFKQDALSSGAGYLSYRILDTLLRSSWYVHAEIEKKLRDVEQEVDDGQAKQSVFKIAHLRRVILQLKAIIDPQRLLTNTLSRSKFEYLDKDINIYFDDLDDFAEKSLYLLESYKDRIISLQQINESLISFRTNQVMKILTVFSVALLPLTVLTGIFGMNISLPFEQNPEFVWSLFVSLGALLIIVFLYLKKKGWI